MRIRNKRTGRVVDTSIVAEMASVIAIAIIVALAFKPLMGLALDLFLAITGGR